MTIKDLNGYLRLTNGFHLPELSKLEVINSSLENIESYKEKLDIDDETKIDFEVIKIEEEENTEQSEKGEDEDEDDEM